jgi:hypothetical protein
VIASLWMFAAVETWIQFLLEQDVNMMSIRCACLRWMFGRLSQLAGAPAICRMSQSTDETKTSNYSK